MLRFMLALLCLLIPGNPPARAEESKGAAHIVIAPAGEDLLVTITLDRPVERLAFDKADVVRDDALKVDSPALVFADDTISSATPFTQVSFRLVEDVKERDAKYPPYYRIGEGRLLYAQTTYPDLEAWDVTLSVEGLAEGWMRWPLDPLPQGYLFLGPEAMVIEDGGARFVFDGKGDPAFEGEVRSSMVRALGFLTETFGSAPAAEPFVATSLFPSDHSFNTGDVTDSAMIALRFFGQQPDPAAPGALATTRSIILHEGVHFWNGGVARFAEGTPQWLHEGGAEYLAKLGSYRLGWSTRDDLQRTIGRWFDHCSTSLSRSEEPALNDLSFIPASLRYSCGPLLHVLAELYLAEDDAGPSITDGWRETVRAASADDGEYDLPDFLVALDSPDLLERPALAAILATKGAERWDTVFDEMRRLGVTIERETSPPLRARTALMHLIRPQCSDLAPGEGYGFYSGEETYRLDTPEGCGILTGNPVVALLAGHPVTALSAQDYADLQALCAAGTPIAFGLDNGQAIMVPCAEPLPSAATQPVIKGLPDIGAFQR